MIKKMNNLSDKIVQYRNEVMNSLLTFDLLQAHLKPAHIQKCCFEDFEYVYRQALSIEEVRMVIGGSQIYFLKQPRLKIRLSELFFIPNRMPK